MKKVIGKILIVIFVVLLSFGLIIAGTGYNMYKEAIDKTSLEEKVMQIKEKDNYTTLDEMPDIYKKAVVAVEDHRFYTHGGIDIIAIGRAIWNDIKAMSFVEGGSTITQQLAKNIYFTQEKSALRKIAEIFMAFELEKNLDKDTIFELYLNTSYFGDGYYCIKDASLGYYGKEPKDMNRNESSMLAGIPNAPSAYCPTDHLDLAQQRQNQVLDKMVKYEYITEEEKNEILQETNAVVEKVNQTEKVSE